jgi:hypothetical protein
MEGFLETEIFTTVKITKRCIMKLKIDFYSKEKMGIQLDLKDSPPFPDNKSNELFMFICFTLRQLSNLGQHPVTQALTGLLVRRESIEALLEKNEYPSAKELLSNLKIYASTRLSMNKSIQEIMRISDALDAEFNHNKAVVEAIDSAVISKSPSIVKPEGNGKKYFEATFPPFMLNTKGFGLLGTDVNHHAFHSVVETIRFLAIKNKQDTNYLNNLLKSSEQCGALFVFKQISYDQANLAFSIINDLGIKR